jgi:nucleotide-binding universal stress UspA family protein
VPVVVGVDGSAHGDRAARAAASVAERSGAPLVLVRAWQLPSLTGASRPEAEASAPPDEREGCERGAQQSAEHSATAVRQAFAGVDVTVRLVEKHPVLALLDAADGAGLVVVGSRGLGGFARLLLGSVSRAVIHHAQTTVLVVRSL